MKPSHPFQLRALCIAVASVFALPQAWANPANPTVTNGSATFNAAGNVLTVTNAPNTIIHWQQFGINANETVRFVQQSAASTVLNRVTGADPSHILGTLQSNGRVFLINPAGIMFGQGAIVDVAGLVASTLNIADSDFLNGRMRFNADRLNPGSVTNAGQITTPNGGFVYLIAPQIENSGIITTPSGEAILAAGNAVELVDSADPALRVKVSAQSQDINLSQMMTQSSGDIFKVLNSGRVSANTAVVGKNGKIVFKSAGDIETTARSTVEAKGNKEADGGTIIAFADGHGRYRGQFNASGRNGGFIETSGHTLDVAGANVIAAALSSIGKGGHWLLDPYNYTIDASAATSLVSALDTGTSVTVTTAADNAAYGSTGAGVGDITVASDILTTAGTGATLTLQADNDIYINSGVDIRSSSGPLHVVLNADHDASGAGGIQMLSGSRIETKGGDIIMGGGASPLTDYAVSAAGSGIDLDNVTLDSRGAGTDGKIQMHGKGSSTNNAAGVKIGGGSQIDSGNGNIDIYGIGGAAAIGGRGVVVSNSNIQTSNGELELDGTGGGNSFSDGVLINAASVIRSTGSGNVLLEGFGSAGAGSNNAAVAIADGGTLIRSNTGNVSILAEGNSTGAGSYGLVMWNGSEVRSDGGNVQVNASSLVTNSVQLDNAGTLIRAAGTNKNVYIDTSSGSVGMNSAEVQADHIWISAAGNLTVTNGWNLNALTARIHSDNTLNIASAPAILPSNKLSLAADNITVGAAIGMGGGIVDMAADHNISITQNITANTMNAKSSLGNISHTGGTINAENLTMDTTVGDVVINGGTITGIDIDIDAGGNFSLQGGSDVTATGTSIHPWARISIDATNISVAPGSIIKSQSIEGAATVKLEASNQTILDNATVEANSSTAGGSQAHVHVFGLQNMQVKNGTSIKTTETNGNDEILLVSQNMFIENSSIGTAGGTHIGINFDPTYMVTNPSDFFAFISTADVLIKNSSIGSANTQALGFGGYDVTLLSSALQADKVSGIVNNDLLLEGSGSGAASLKAVDEMHLAVGNEIDLESFSNSAKIEVTAPTGKLYFHFPLRGYEGWDVDGVASALTSPLSPNTGIFVNGAPAIKDQNFFVTYGGVNFPLRDILRRPELDESLQEFEMAEGPELQEFFSDEEESGQENKDKAPRKSKRIRECS